MKTVTRLLALGALISIGCGDNPPRSDDEAGDAPDSGITLDGDADADADGDAETGSGTAEGDGDGDSTGDADTTADDADDSPTTTTTSDDDDGPDTKFDLGTVPDAAHNCMTDEDAEFSFLWAANSGQGTISKIDTQMVTEVGRYVVRPDSAGSPSRTSVSLSGNVAVANRNGGVTKIFANPEHCDESKNGMAGLQTSNNNQFLPWGQDDCVAWYTPFGYQSQRPVAWGPGEFNQGTCNYENEEVWTSGTNGGAVIDILVLDGDDGTVVEMIQIPTGGNSLINSFYGIYGGAVDGDGNFWGTQLGSTGKLIKVVRSDMSYTVYDPPDGPHWYGMTVDVDGMVWMCSNTAGRFDPMTESFATGVAGGYTGCMADANENGLLWMSRAGGGIVGVNRDTLQVEQTCAAGGPSYGVSIDFEGYVWGVTGSTATKWDPETCQSWQYAGLTGAYTYSDMTGYALSNAGTPSG